MELTERPVLNALKVIPDRDGVFFYVYVPNQREISVTNAVGKRTIELCDGNRSIDDIVSVLAQEFDASRDQIIADIMPFFERMQQEGIWRGYDGER